MNGKHFHKPSPSSAKKGASRAKPAMKASLRKDGKRRVTVHLKAHIGFEDVVLALINEYGLYGWDIKQGRSATWALTRRFMGIYGEYGWSNVSDELRDQVGKECAERAAKLFPELVGEAERKEWELTCSL